jgi:catechol 2,3-dioxygenase-like lactoylglutathione lyase family enzyme
MMDLNQVTLPAVDLRESVDFYTRMGFLQIVDSPHYARFECPDGDATFSLHTVDTASPRSGVTTYFEHEALDELYAELRARGFEFEQAPVDRSWLWREAILIDPAGNRICLYRAGENRKHPPWRMA